MGQKSALSPDRSHEGKPCLHFVVELQGSHYILKAFDHRERVWFSQTYGQVLDAVASLERLKDGVQQACLCVPCA